MHLILTGDHISAVEAQKMNLISKVFGTHAETLAASVKTAQKMASYEIKALCAAKALINCATHVTDANLRHEQDLFCAQFENVS